VANYRAAMSLCRGLLPAVVICLAAAGCRSEPAREAGGPNPTDPAGTPATAGANQAGSVVPARVANPAAAAVPADPADPAMVAVAGAAPGAGAARGPAAGGTPRREGAETGVALDGVAGVADAPGPPREIVYHVVKGARFFDILVARIGNREHVVIGETDDMCLDLPDQRDFDGDGNRDALVFRSPRCRGDAAPGLLFFVSADTTFRLSNPFPGHRPRVERWNGEWSVLAGGTRHVLRGGRAVLVEDSENEDPDLQGGTKRPSVDRRFDHGSGRP